VRLEWLKLRTLSESGVSIRKWVSKKVRAEIFAQLDPVVFGNGEKDLHNLGIELRSGTAANLLARVRDRKSIAIGPVVRHCIENVGYGDDA